MKWRGGPTRWVGFTLVELMIVITIIGILAMIAVPKFASLVKKSKEGATKGSLGAIRSALSIYYGTMEGLYPVTLSALTLNAKYLQSVPLARTPTYHADASTESDGIPNVAITDSGGWAYVNDTTNNNFGTIWVNCTHTDAKGTTWSSY